MRDHNTRSDGSPFGEATIETVWEMGTPGGYPNFRRDVCGASIYRSHYGQQTRYGWGIDHIKPISKGGTDDLSNLRPLHWENLRAKGDSFPDSAWTCKATS